MEPFPDYVAGIKDPTQRARTREVLTRVVRCFPQLTPRIAWNQPMFTDHGTFIIGFSTAKRHLAVAPEIQAIQRFSAEIRQAGYAHTQQLIRIPWDGPVEFALLERIIAYNIADKADCTTFWRKA